MSRLVAVYLRISSFKATAVDYQSPRIRSASQRVYLFKEFDHRAIKNGLESRIDNINKIFGMAERPHEISSECFIIATPFVR